MSNKQMKNVVRGDASGTIIKIISHEYHWSRGSQALGASGFDQRNSIQCLQNAGFFHSEDQRLCRSSTGVRITRLRVKVLGGQAVYPNDIIARQRGFKWKSGDNVIVGLDQTIHSKVEGIVSFRLSKERKIPFYYIDVIPQ
jgi:ribosomal protein L27